MCIYTRNNSIYETYDLTSQGQVFRSDRLQARNLHINDKQKQW